MLANLASAAIGTSTLTGVAAGTALIKSTKGIEPEAKSRDELKAFGEAEKEKWGRLIRAAGLKPAS